MRSSAIRRGRSAALAATATATAISCFLATPTYAQTSDDTASDEPAIVVIGTRRTDRSVTDSASPIDVIGATELGQQPTADMLETVRNLVPSFFVAQNTISDASTFVRPPSLRGLGADQILVMINGKRYNRAALVQVYTGGDTALSFGSQGSDISNIPSISVKNLQILRDGATAQYGSDAIGGVINYQIRDDAGYEVQALWGQNYEGDGDRKQVAAYAGFKLGDAGFFTLSGEWYEQDGTSRGATRPIAVALAQANPGVVSSIPNYPGPAQIWGTSPGDGWKAFANAGFDLTDGIQLYGTFNYADTGANQSFNYRSPISAPAPLVTNTGSGFTSTASPGRNGSFNPIYLTPCPTTGATGCPTGGFVLNSNTFGFASVYPGGFTPRFQGDVEQLYGTVGLKGKADSGFTWDLSGTMAKNTLSLSMTDSLSASFGPQSQTAFFFGNLIQREQNLNLDLTYPLEVGFASPVTLSAGAEWRREEYETTVGDLQSYAAGPYASQPLYQLVSPGVYSAVPNTAAACPRYNSSLPATATCTATQSPAASGYGGVSPLFAGKNAQKSYGAYFGAEADLTDALTMGVAGRWEHYDTFGDAFVWKANALFKLTEAVSVRGTIGTGFHAPSPGQNNTQILTTNFRSGNQIQTGTYPVTSAIAQYYGATALKPEKSNNYGAGFVFKPMNAMTLTIDGYIIDVKDRIGISQTYTVSAADLIAQPALASVGQGGDVNYFTNGFNTSTKGIDAVLTYRADMVGAQTNWTLAYAYNESKVTFRRLSTTGTPLISDAQVFNVANLPPRHRINASTNWQFGDLQVNARANYYSSWANQLEYPGQRFGDKVTADLDVSYTFMDHFTLTVGANNIFDAYPDRIAPTTTNPIYQLTNSLADGQVYPRSGGPFGLNGGFYYARIRVKY
ncbi:iron complex outermembrane receptor protein [Novosphingobium kunmingense]|uniref:Iron complex outermembrane receptor protein n=1 Tax=Novosphingobium kunmingense TaxID=1211806 RepID=A0A2N0HJN4_9SPHN|nr:TonB-dependent receptor [Novosphingobium kunmingense]PKB19154.1 iron complex outermembrane receptor protein [Novosphingobium kunmingense]